MKLPLPIEIVKGRRPHITQEYGNTSFADWYKSNGINIDAHNGTDIIIIGGKAQGQDTYGTRLVSPTNSTLTRTWFTTPMSTKGNGIELRWDDERGAIHMLLWHTSELNTQNTYKEGETLAYIGNSGLTSPSPSVWNVYAGSHLHLGTFINGVLCNPREIFDFDKWYVSETDTSIEKDLSPFQYYINQILSTIKGLTGK